MSQHIVMYIDGSARPNPGKTGWGAHGYLYRTTATTPKKLNDYFITAKGYFEKLEHHEAVEPEHYFDFCVHEPSCDTNNAGELFALYRVLLYFKDQAITSIDLYTDSEYVRKGLTEYIYSWIKNNWRRADGIPIMRAETWQKVHALREDYAAKNIQLNLHWVKGHAGTYGNILADRLAAIAANKGHTDPNFADYRITDAKKYQKTLIERHPFMCFRRMYFSNASHVPDSGCYFIAEPGDEQQFGRKVSEAAYAVIYYHEPDPLLESIKEKQRGIMTDFIKTIMVKLDRVYDKTIYPYLKDYGSDCLVAYTDRQTQLNFIDGRNITCEITPAGLSLRAMDNFTLLEQLLNNYLSSDCQLQGEFQQFDITDKFYHISEKKDQRVYTLKEEYNVGYKDTSIDLTIRYLDHPYRAHIPLILGGDLLPRNNLKKLEPLEPTIHLVLYPESSLVFRYACIIHVNNAVGIWSNYNSDRVFLTPHTEKDT